VVIVIIAVVVVVVVVVVVSVIQGTSPVVGRRPTRGCTHSKITHVHVLSWPLPLLTSLYFLAVTQIVTEFLSHTIAL